MLISYWSSKRIIRRMLISTIENVRQNDFTAFSGEQVNSDYGVRTADHDAGVLVHCPSATNYQFIQELMDLSF